MIRLDDFHYRYQGGERWALREICLEIERGEFALLTGPSGCGKSTLALALAGFLFSQFDGEYTGEVEVAGLDVPQQPIYQLADVVGLVQQDPESQFCTLTVEDEIVFGLENRQVPRGEMDRLLTWSLGVVGASALRQQPLSALSGGEKQKVAIAAILAAQPQVIIFDEPTSNLDPPSTQDIFDVILGMQREMDLTVLVIEHKLDFLREIQPRVIEMGMGTIRDPWRTSYAIGDLGLQPPRYEAGMSRAVVEVREVSAGYPGNQVLEDVSFSVQAGELVSLMGDNGAGKSTLLLSMLDMVERQRGEIRIAGKELAEVTTARVGRYLGLVFQNPNHQLFASTVWDEAVFGARNFGLLPADYEEKTRELLSRAGLEAREEDPPYQLSYGQKRRLNLISVLTYRPEVLLLDEMFIGQDRENARFLLSLLCDYVAQGGSVIMVNHNPAYYPEVATRLMFLSSGRLVIDAPTRQGMRELERMGKAAYLPGGAP